MFIQLISLVFPFIVQNSPHPPVEHQIATRIIRPTRIPKATYTPRPTHTPHITSTPRPTKTPTLVKANTPAPNIVSNDTQLFNEINVYRKTQGKNSINVDSLLCSIAQKRIEELIKKGSLDNHEGVQKFSAQMLQSFSKWWEVIHQSSPPWSAHHIVTNGWAQSPPHNEAILANDATHGCGTYTGGFAVFLLGKK